MIPPSIGDLAQSYYNRNANARLTAELGRLSDELTTGLKADIARATSGDVGPIASIERSLSSLDAYDTATAEARLLSEVVQSALGNVAGQLNALAPLAVAVQDGGDQTAVNTVIAAAADSFDSAIGALNTRVTGRTLFGGVDTDSDALLGGPAIRAELAIATAGATTAAQYSDAIDAYFAPGGGFETSAYVGSTTSRADLRLSPDDTVEMGVRADDLVIRTALAGIAKAAVLDAGGLAGNLSEQGKVVSNTVPELFSADRNIVELQASVGLVQARVETAEQRNDAERAGLERTRLDLIGIDPFETATRLEETQTQLESLYAITARLSRLSLANYL